MSRFDQCRARVLAYTDELIEAIKVGRLNASAFDGLIRSYVYQPAYDAVFRAKLVGLALTRLDGRGRE